MTQWEDVDVPKGGNYIGWGNKVGQHVTGAVLSYDLTGGTDANGNVVPELQVRLTDKAASFNKEGDRKDYESGEDVSVTVSLGGLKRAINAAQPKPGDLVKIVLSELIPVAKGKFKAFEIKIARGAGLDQITETVKTSAPASSGGGGFDDDEPPF